MDWAIRQRDGLMLQRYVHEYVSAYFTYFSKVDFTSYEYSHGSYTKYEIYSASSAVAHNLCTVFVIVVSIYT